MFIKWYQLYYYLYLAYVILISAKFIPLNKRFVPRNSQRNIFACMHKIILFYSKTDIKESKFHDDTPSISIV